jgi:hypothetical protein
MPMVGPVPTVIWPVPTLAYADSEVPTVTDDTVDTDYADDIFSCADGRGPSAPCLCLVVLAPIHRLSNTHV